MFEGQGGGDGTYHVKGNDIFEGNFASFELFDEDFVDEDWAGTGGKTEDEGMCRCWCEGFDSVFKWVRDGGEVRCGILTDDVVCDVG